MITISEDPRLLDDIKLEIAKTLLRQNSTVGRWINLTKESQDVWLMQAEEIINILRRFQ